MMHDQARNWPTPTSLAYPSSHYLYPPESSLDTEGGLGAGVYGTYASWPSALSSIPVPIPRSTSSSLAAALVPPRTPTPPRQLSKPPSKEPYSSTASNSTSSSTCVDSASSARTSCDMSNASRRSDNQSFAHPTATPPFQGHEEMYQGQQLQAPTPMPSSEHFSYPQTQDTSSFALGPASYTRHAQQYIPPQQQLQQQQRLPPSQTQTNEPFWPPDPGFSMYSNNLPPNPSDPSNFPASQQNFSFVPTGVGGYSGYSADSGTSGWPYQAHGDMYFDFDAASAGSSTWPETSFGPQDHHQHMSVASNAAPSIAAPVDHIAATTGYISDPGLGRSTSRPDAGIFDGNYFSEHTSRNCQKQQPTPAAQPSGAYRQYMVAEQHSGQQLPYEPTNMEQCEATQHPFVHSLDTVAASTQSTREDPKSQTVVSYTGASRKKGGARTETQGHNPLMAPPPVPVRARTTSADALKSSNRLQNTSERRHTVAEPSGPVIPSRSAAASPSVGSFSAANTRSSSAGPPSSSSDSHDSELRRPLVRPPTPQMATTHLCDAQWAQAQEANRCALSETYRMNHGVQEPPAEMRIKETSALERSQRLDAPLSTALARERSEKAKQVEAGERDEPTQSQAASTSTAGDATREACGNRPAIEDISDKEFFSRPLNPRDWTPALPVPNIQKLTHERASTSSNQIVSPISPSSTEGLITPRDPCTDFSVRPALYAYEVPADPSAHTVRSEVLLKSVLPLLRHDGHLAPHVSGLGGACVSAYDGRSYLPDDADMDPNHIPPPPPGARSGDYLTRLRPNPLTIRGQVRHDLINPPPTPKLQESNTNEGDLAEKAPGINEGEANEDEQEGQNEKEEAESEALEEKDVKKEEKGLGWGFVEGGSHGPAFALDGKGALDNSGATRPVKRLKLSTEKKTTPKMACHFCRNRKIACGPSKCGEPSLCNQCERRELRCTFPTISRRGMRTRGARSGTSLDGAGDSDVGMAEYGESLEDSRGDISLDHNWETLGLPNPNTLTKSGKVRKPRDKTYKVKAHAKGRGKGKGKGKVAPLEVQDEERDERRADDVEMGEEATDSTSQMQVDDPLASLAAEMRRRQQREPQPSHASSPALYETTSSMSASDFSSNFNMPFPPPNLGGDYSMHIGSTHTFYTTPPLHQRGQQSNNSSS